MRRWRLAALLVARLDRLGLSALQAFCARGDAAAAGLSQKRLLRRIKRACNAKCHVRWPIVFGSDAPVHLEVCAGGGEWIAEQARQAPEQLWVASELRGDRIHQIVDRMRCEALSNLAVLGGDAALALHHHTRPRSFASIWVTFPEPPADHGDGSDFLLDAAFLAAAVRALAAGGRLLVVSDNLRLLDRVAASVLGLPVSLDIEHVSGTARGASAVNAWVGAAGRKLITEGWPEGFGAGASSYFDRLWASRAKQRRFHIEVRREG